MKGLKCILYIAGVERLAGMSLKDPERIAVSSRTQSSKQRVKTQNQSSKSNTDSQPSCTDDSFALPENLQQYFVITPCKLRLVTLLTFVMSKYKVSPCLFYKVIILTVILYLHQVNDVC